MRVLVVDDDPALLEALAVSISFHWPHALVLAAPNADAGAEAFYREEPDVVLLDVVMRGRSGLELLREIRRVSGVPIIMVTASAAESDVIRGLDLGADDYIAKPFGHLEMLARMKVAMRRAGREMSWSATGNLTVGGVVLSPGKSEASVCGTTLRLTPIEHRLLHELMRNAGRVLPHGFLIARVWGDDQAASVGSLKTLVGRLRGKLASTGARQEYIETEKGTGYRFASSPHRDLAASN
jgi:DNA-binding response OmpR family regulator